MINQQLYKEYFIVGPFDDGTYDINDITDELVDGNLESVEECMNYIDKLWNGVE